MSDKRFTLRWGILATGGIAHSFARDLSINPSTRNRNDIEHVAVAAASSSSADRAAKFLKAVNAPDSAKAYGSYKDLVADQNIDIVYVATPHSHHYQNVMLCLEAGKNVLCEKAFTVNAKQAELLIQKAREKKLFLMEAIWTRYMPISIYVRQIVTSGKIGTVERVFSDVSIGGPPPEERFDDSHRLVNPDLAGGALLDTGIYALTWVFQTLYTTQTNPQPPTLSSAVRKYKLGTDQSTCMLLTFPREKEGDAHGIATCSLRVNSNPGGKDEAGPCIRVQGTKGEVQVFPPAHNPDRSKLVLHDGAIEEKDWSHHPGPGKGSGFVNGFGDETYPEGDGMGMFWEADECAYAIRDGRKEGRLESLEESLTIMKVMDEVRRQANFRFPDHLESTEFPLDF